MARLPILVRRSKVFDLVVAGKTYQEISRQLDISEDTVARDMQAIGEEIQVLCRERAGEILAVAVANIQAVIDAAWADYRLETKRERAWYAGKLDYDTLEVVTKGVGAGDVDDESIEVTAAQVLEVKEKRSKRRPGLSVHKAKYLDIVLAATRELTQLTGLQKLVVEHQGPGGGPIRIVAIEAIKPELSGDGA